MGPTSGIPFSDDSDDYEGTGEEWDEEMQQAAKLFDEEGYDSSMEGSEAESRSLISTGSSDTLGTTTTTKRRRKKKKAKVGLATADLVRWRPDDALRLPENIRPPLGKYRLEVVSVFTAFRFDLNQGCSKINLNAILKGLLGYSRIETAIPAACKQTGHHD